MSGGAINMVVPYGDLSKKCGVSVRYLWYGVFAKCKKEGAEDANERHEMSWR